MNARSARPETRAAVRTFLIADIRGYTSYTRERGDEAASRLAARFAQIATEGVEAWGGTLLELRGDEALAVFDSPRQALRSAVELEAAFSAETEFDPELPLRVGFGLDAGEAVPVGDGYRGAALNLAARLCSVAQPGQIIASQGLVHLAGAVPDLVFRQLEPAALKGFDRPAEAVEVSSAGSRQALRPAAAQADQPPLPPVLDPIVPLVGRESELRLLGWHWRRARHGSGRTVVISGIPGIGKTRLSAELATRVHAAGAPVIYLPAGQGIADIDPGRIGNAGPLLIIVDDVDAAPASAMALVARLANLISHRQVLLLVTHRQTAAPELSERVASFSSPERSLQLTALEPDSVRAIAALYAGTVSESLPLDQILAESGGVPAAVHRVASAWARNDAAARLGLFAQQTSAGRRGLRDAESRLVSSVADLELARERSALFAAEGEDQDGAAAGSRHDICPYKGLAAFEAADSEYFFGRERLVAELVARLVGSSFLGVVGASGSGKSSAIRAGLLPALAGGVLPSSDRWPQLLMRPGEQPLAELGRALSIAMPEADLPVADAQAALDAALSTLAPDQRLMLVVDQFEEVFNATRDEAERQAFIDLLTAERRGLKVLVAMRADHYAHCAPYPELARLIGTSQVLVGPLVRAELVAVIERPSQRVGLRVEGGLSDTLLDDLGDEPGALPLLSTALLELWQARDQGRLTLAAYHASGGVRGAVARLAESAYTRLAPDQQSLARSIFLRLSGPGEGEGVVRRRVPLTELDIERDQRVADVLDVLTDARLLTTGEGYVEVAHEALLREWPRLQAWLAEDATGRQLRLHLADAARDWEKGGREAGDLYRGARLVAALEWAADHDAELNALEREYLAASEAESEREIAQQRRTNRRLRALLAGTAAFLLVAIAAGIFALDQAQRAEREALTAEQEAARAEREAAAAVVEAERAEREAEAAQQAERLARARELVAAAQAALETDPSLARLLALASLEHGSPDLDSLAVIRRAHDADRVVARYLWPQALGSEASAALHPDGRRLVAAGRQHLETWDFETDSVAWSTNIDEPASVGRPFFSSDGAVVIAGVHSDDDDAAIRESLGVMFWDAANGRLLRQIDVGACGGYVHAVSDVRLLVESACADEGDSAFALISLESDERRPLPPEAEAPTMSGDGRVLAFGDFANLKGIIRQIDDGETLLEFSAADQPGRLNPMYPRLLSHDGRWLVAGDRPMVLWDVEGRRVQATFGGHTAQAVAYAFTKDGSTMYSVGTDDSTLRVWNVARGTELASYPGAAAHIRSGELDLVSISDYGWVLVSDHGARESRLLYVGPRGDAGEIATCPGFVSGFSLNAAADHAAFSMWCDEDSWFHDAQTFVVDIAELQVVNAVRGYISNQSVLSPDGTLFVRQDAAPAYAEPANDEEADATLYQPVRVRDALTGEIVSEFSGICTFDGDTVTHGPPWLQDGCNPYPDEPFPVFHTWSLRWSPDSRLVAVVQHPWNSDTPWFGVWDAQTGQRLTAYDSCRVAPYDVIFSPDGEEVIVHCADEGFVALSTRTWEEQSRSHARALDSPCCIRLAGYSDDGSKLIAVGGLFERGASLLWIDVATLEAEILDGIFTEFNEMAAISPGRSLIALGGARGAVQVWDVHNRRLLHQLSVGGTTEIRGVAFFGDDRVAVTPSTGNILISTLDPDEVVRVAREHLVRGFTPEECERFSFGDDCPTLEEMRGD